jgi:hypothetical protein
VKNAVWAIILPLILGGAALAEEAVTTDSTQSDVVISGQAEAKDPYAGDVKKILEPITLSEDYDQGKLQSLELAKRHRDPTRAMLQSMLVPGWGQFYNNQPAKAALAIAGEGLSGTLTVYNYIIMAKYDRKTRHAFRLAHKYYDGNLKGEGNYQTKLGVDYNDHYKYFTIETEKNLWFLIGTIFLSALDAYVNANLSDFDIYDLPRDPNAPQDMVIPIWGMSVSW